MTYTRSKLQMILMGLFVICMWCINFYLVDSRVLIITTTPVFATALVIVNKQYKQKVKIDNANIMCIEPNKSTTILYREIYQIKYVGIRWIPLFDRISVRGGAKTIYIDSTYIAYKDSWLKLLINLKAVQPHFKIDRRILQRLKVDENLQPIDA